MIMGLILGLIAGTGISMIINEHVNWPDENEGEE